MRQFLSRFFKDLSELAIFMARARNRDPFERRERRGEGVKESTAPGNPSLRLGHSLTGAAMTFSRRPPPPELRPDMNCLMLRVACRRRWTFSTMAMRT